MIAQDALRTALREQLGPAARKYGFKGSAPTWRKSSNLGDWAVVNVQSSSSSSRDHLRCVVNLAFSPEPSLRWDSERLGAHMPKSVSVWEGMYTNRLHPEGTPPSIDGWWDVRNDESAQIAVTDMIAQLEQHGWPVLEQMFSRDAMMARVRSGDLGFLKRSNVESPFIHAEALLLMDSGWSEALEELLDYALESSTPLTRAHAERFDAWVRAEASKSTI